MMLSAKNLKKEELLSIAEMREKHEANRKKCPARVLLCLVAFRFAETW